MKCTISWMRYIIALAVEPQCATLDKRWKNVRTERTPPINEGTQMNYQCPMKYAKIDPTAKAVCQDEKIIVSGHSIDSIDQVPCFEIGK